MSNYLYVLIPCDAEVRPDSPEECYQTSPSIPQLNGVESELAERDGLYLFPGFLLINTCYSMYMILPGENGPSPSRQEVYKIAQAMDAPEVWYVQETAADKMFGFDKYSFDRFKTQIDGEDKDYLTEYSPELTEIAGYIHDDFRDLKSRRSSVHRYSI